EGDVVLERLADALDGGDGGGERDEEAEEAERLQRHPPGRVPLYPPLPDVHLHRVVHRQRPEPDGAEEAQDVVEEGHHDGEHRADDHERRPPRQPEHVDAERPAGHDGALPGDELRARPPPGGERLDGGEDGLAEHLVGADQVDHDADVGEVDQPVGLVEAEPGEHVPRRRVPERRVPQAPAQHVERRRGRHPQQRCLLHRLVLRRWRLHRLT
ncbi:Os06g0556101, partial [Oryza sativa Japonica Group]